MARASAIFSTPDLENLLQHFQRELQLLAANDGAEIELPKLSGEAKAWPLLIEIHDQFQPNCSPKVCQRNVRANRFELHFGVERKELPVGDEAVESVTV